MLHMCTKKHMDYIAKVLYKIPNKSRLTKEPLYRAIFDHMITEKESVQHMSFFFQKSLQRTRSPPDPRVK